jgi:hypothetical protein
MNIISAFWYEEERSSIDGTSWLLDTYNGVQSWVVNRAHLSAWAVADGDIARNASEVSEPAPISILLGVLGLMTINRKIQQKRKIQSNFS